MKIWVILFFFGLTTLHAESFSQVRKVSLEVNNQALLNVLDLIQEQSGYTFLFSSSDIQNIKDISLSVKEENVSIVLDRCLKGTNLNFEINGNLIILKKQSQPVQEKVVVKGVVKNKQGATLPGVTILIKGTTLGVSTNIDGEFKMSVPETKGLVLVFSYIGMETQEIAYKGQESISVIMQENVAQMDEVVVTGYQTISRERATGAFDIIKQDQLNKPAVDISSRLIGTAAGVQAKLDADGKASFEIRGRSSLYANADPLIVVDGFAIEGDFSSINPNDVESVSILKDAASASIWGARAANGVIVITTKKAQQGTPLHVEVSAFTRIGGKLDLNYVNPLASSAQTVDYEKRIFGRLGGSHPVDAAPVDYRDVSTAWSGVMTTLNEYQLGKISEMERDQLLEQFKQLDNRNDIRKYLLQNPVYQQYNVMISGGTKSSNSVLSLMYDNNKSNFKETGSQKYMLNFRTNYNIVPWLDFNIGTTLQYSENKNNGLSLSDIKGWSPYDMFVDKDGNQMPMKYYQFYTPNIERYVPTDLFPYKDWSYNPVREIKANDLTSNNLNVRFQAGIRLKFAQGISLDSKIQYELIQDRTRNRFGEDGQYVRNLINTYASWDRTAGTVKANVSQGDILDMNDATIKAYNFRNQINIHRIIADQHEIVAIAGMEVSSRVRTSHISPRTFGYNDDRQTVGEFPTSSFKNWYNSSYTLPYLNEYTHTTARYFSMFANAAYTYDNRYSLSASARTDASNMITDDPKYRYAPFWSVGLGWEVTNEKFMKEVSWLDKLHLRLTYGYNGNVDKSTAFKPLLSLSSAPDKDLHEYTAKILSYGNPTLRWEKTGTTNIGIDFFLFGGKLYGKLDYYNKKGKDLIAEITIPSLNGTKNQKLNNAEMTNKGIEIELGTTLPIVGRKIEWNGNFNFSYNKNEVTNLYRSVYNFGNLASGADAFVQGHDASAAWVTMYGGIKNVGTATNPVYAPHYKDVNGNLLMISNAAFPQDQMFDYVVNRGVKTAPYTMGFVNRFKIYDFDLSFTLIGKFGAVFQTLPFNYPGASGKPLPNEQIANIPYYENGAWVGDPMKRIPMSDNVNDFQPTELYMDYLLQSASHIRLQELSVGYNLPANWVSRIGMNRVRIYVQCNNLGTIVANNAKEDPEFPKGTLKPQPTYSFGVKLDF